MDMDEPSAAEPQPLPLLHLMEERAGERRSVLGTARFLSELSDIKDATGEWRIDDVRG
jgi:hypothetical protein